MIGKDKSIKLQGINDARIVLLGIAAFLVTFFHSDLLNIYDVIGIEFIADIINFVKKTGNFGVDIFLFLSGIGLYFSISKNNLKTFYKNRFIRILPEFILTTVIYNMITKTMTAVEVFETIFFVAFFIKGILDIWFMPFIMVMYLIFPLIYKIIKKYDLAGLLSLLFVVVVFNLLYSILFPISYIRIELALTRIPVFILGAFFGKKIYQNETISMKMFFVSIIAQLIILVILYMNLDIERFSIFARYIYCLLTITTVINLSVLYSLIKNKNMIGIKFLKLLGTYSLELYLIFEKVEYILIGIYKPSSYVLFYILCFCITIVLSYVVKKFVNLLIKLVGNLYNKINSIISKRKCLN